MAELHILNGDNALALLQKCGFNGKCLVWRETYLEGPLPDTDDLHVFRTARAGFLIQFAELKGINFDRMYQHLKKMDDTLPELSEKSAITLWFDSYIFDQTLLMRILYLLFQKKCRHDIWLYCCDSFCLKEEDFKTGKSRKVRLLPQDLEIAAKAWRLFAQKDAPGMIRCAEQENFERLSKMKKALFRCAEEVPDSDGLNRSQRQILAMTAEKSLTFIEIFKTLPDFEEYPFLGDTACQRLLDALVQKGLLECRNGKYSSLRCNDNNCVSPEPETESGC